MGAINWFSKDLDAIDTELTLINQHMSIVKYLVPIGSEVILVSDLRLQTPTPAQKNPTEPTLSVFHKLFWECINMLLEYHKCFVCGNRHPYPRKFCPTLDAGYILNKDEEGLAKKITSIPTGCQHTIIWKLERGGVHGVIPTFPHR